MKSKIKIIALSLMLVMASIVLLGCVNNNGGNMARLNATIATEIRQAYFNEFVKPLDDGTQLSDVKILVYYGTFGESVVVVLNSGARQAIGQETAAGIEINYADSRRIWVWNDNNFHTLQEAYDDSLLTVGNIQTIAGIQNARVNI